MRTAVTLYEFMPYGAPELLESRQRHMARALILTSAAALALYALTGGIASLFPAAAVVAPQAVVVIDTWPAPIVPAEVKPPAPAPPIKYSPAVHEAARPVPVIDAIATASDLPPTSTSKADPSGTGSVLTPNEVGAPAQVIEALPAFGTWVYVEREPEAITQVKPDYPEIAQKAGVEGRVTVHVLVGKEGRVLDTVLAAKVQVPMLNEAALAAARQWVFTPGYANGHPVACWTAIPFHFRLH